MVGADECGAGAGKDLEEEKGDKPTMNNDNDQHHTTNQKQIVEVGERRRR